MAIPKEILAVERPKNTFVVAYGKDGNRYGVRKYIGCRYVKGRHLPVKGPTVGHIVDGRYVALSETRLLAESVGTGGVDLKDWAGIALCDRLFSDILAELEAFYHREDALRIYCIAVLRVCNPGANDYELAEFYRGSFLSERYPDVAMSKNVVSKFLKDLGKACSRISGFMNARAKKIRLDHHILVDGTLKTNDSAVNSLSDFSRKAKVKGNRDISVLYAFDLDLMEPVCSKCYPGNMLDVNAYEDFISSNGITSGLIVADKGFPASATAAHRAKNPNLHYLNPIKRNAKFIETHNMLSFDGVLEGRDGVTFKKAKVSGKEKWLYSFRDACLAAQEERTYIAQAGKSGKFDNAEFLKMQRSFGTIVLECDLDLAPIIVYRTYEDRWQIEVVMRYYKTACEFDVTKVHSDYSVIGSEFCNFLASLLTFRLIREFDRHDLLKKRTYGRLMSLLRRAKKVRVDSASWRLINVSPSLTEILQKLSLVPKPTELPKRRPGRPRKIFTEG